MRLLVLGAVAAVLIGCGEEPRAQQPGLRWVAPPAEIAATPSDPSRILRGEVRNASEKEIIIRAAEIVLRDAGGRPVDGNAIFLPGYVRPGEPQNRGGEPFADTEAERIGRLARIPPAGTAPLVISWRVRDGRPVTIEYPGGALRLSP